MSLQNLSAVSLLPALSLALLLGDPARAGNDVDLAVSSKVYIGEKPRLTLKINKDVKEAVLDVKGSNGQRHKATKGPGDAGGELVFELPQSGTGQVQWVGSLEVYFADGSAGSMPLKFSTEVIGKLDVRSVSSREEIVDENKIRVVMSRKAGKVDVKVLGDDGEVLANVSKAFNGEPPGTELTVEWIPKTTAKPFMVEVVAHDSDGIFSPNLEVYVFKIDIPHEEVLFETGKAEIRPSEEPKLKAALEELNRVLAKYKKALQYSKDRARLVIMGHTDSVGSAASNQALSEARARSIAHWFRTKGVKLPIYARGYGESMLKVQTPDETENAANRRVDYRVTTEDTGIDGAMKIQ